MLTLPPEIARQASKTACFQQLFQREAELQALQEASDLQAAWMNGGMTLNEVLYGLAAEQAATALRPFGGGGWDWGYQLAKG